MNISFYFSPIHLTASISGCPSDEHHSETWGERGCTQSGKSLSSGRGRFLPLSSIVSLLTKSGVKQNYPLTDTARRLTLHLTGDLGCRHVLKSQNGIPFKYGSHVNKPAALLKELYPLSPHLVNHQIVPILPKKKKKRKKTSLLNLIFPFPLSSSFPEPVVFPCHTCPFIFNIPPGSYS